LQFSLLNKTIKEYTSLFSDNNANLTLPQRTYSLRKSPKSSFLEVYYDKSTYLKDSDYGLDAEILSYNTKGLPVDTRIEKGGTSRILYLNPTVSNGSIANLGKPDAQNRSLSFNKIYLGPAVITEPNLLETRLEREPETGRLLVERDKNNNVIRRYGYHVKRNAISSISWDETQFIKLCQGSDVILMLNVKGLVSSYQAQFSTDGGITWLSANNGNNGFIYIRPAGTGTQEIRARAVDNPSAVITTQKDISCAVIPFGWGPYTVGTLEVGPPKVCQYDLSVVGLSVGGIGQFSIDNGATWINANIGNDKMQFALYAAPVTQQFWARDSNYPSNVITININVCQ
jgi:hypothetical protein